MEKKFIVLAYLDYYPAGDNIRGMYDTWEEAEKRVQELNKTDSMDNVRWIEVGLGDRNIITDDDGREN